MTDRRTFALTCLDLVCLTLYCAIAPPCMRAQQANPDAQVVGVDEDTSPTALRAAAWMRLENGVTGTKNTDTRLAAIAALSLLGNDARAEHLVRGTLHDADVDVRLAAIVAAGEMAKDQGPRSSFPSDLRDALNDPDPKVAFTAASTLWKIDDPSGEDILTAVAEGERSADYSFWKGSKHTANRTLHSPAALAKIGAQQGLLILVPPVGIGMGAYGYLKGPGGQSPQVIAITQLAKEHNAPVKNSLIEATKVKDAGARLAAVEALARFSGADVLHALQPLLTDSKENVRFSASAAYLRVGSASTQPDVSPEKENALETLQGRIESSMDTVERFRQLALALPHAAESSHMGATDFRLHDRIFATLAYAAKGLATLKLTPEQQADWIGEAPQHFEPAPGGWGRTGMTLVRLDAPSDVIEGALRVSYNNVLNKQQAKKRGGTRRSSQA